MNHLFDVLFRGGRAKTAAVCISGQLRTYDACLASIKTNLIDPLNADVFVATWSEVGSSHKESITNNTRVVSQDLYSAYNAKNVIVSEFDSAYFDELQGILRPLALKEAEPIHSKSALPSFFLMHQADELRRLYERRRRRRYDTVVRIRPDLLLKSSISTLNIEVSDTTSVWVSDYTIDPKVQVSDKFVFGSSYAMDRYSSVFEHLEEYWEQPLGDGSWAQARVGERLMKHHCEKMGLATKFFSLDCEILRGTE